MCGCAAGAAHAYSIRAIEYCGIEAGRRGRRSQDPEAYIQHASGTPLYLSCTLLYSSRVDVLRFTVYLGGDDKVDTLDRYVCTLRIDSNAFSVIRTIFS